MVDLYELETDLIGMDVDVIGDVHGHADALEALLEKLGYWPRAGAWRHPSRQALFVGDLMDRGPRQFDAIDIVRRMRDAGAAKVVMGNHEFNAIAFATVDPGAPGRHYRRRHAENVRHHAAFLAAVGGADSPSHAELIAFFKTMPLWFESPHLRVVHACWSPKHMTALIGHLDHAQCLTDAGFHAVQIKGTPAWQAAETLLKGPEMTLPNGVSYLDAQGIRRTKSRTRWWDEAVQTLREACAETAITDQIPDSPIPPEFRFHYDGRKPLFFGHYWMIGPPHLLGPDRACVDFSIAKGGVLCAYQHNGSPTLDASNFKWVAA